MLADRYRILGLLGKGGMGEVHRADDLKLRQSVALKFLPAALSNDAEKLERFHHEVRVARQVSHPNVCRVYDIAEADGQHFISMEYIDGEDLASVLRRMGKPSADKAVQIVRQLCAGLAAAHDKGVLHRDLKPHNVMIDGLGAVRVMDFGLAGFVEEFSGRDVGAGTPAYMAPEQLAGREVSVKSDIYSLGLVLYELFTGKRMFDGTTRERVERSRTTTQTPTLSSLSEVLDPAIERIIQRCLETEPAARPSSALAVAAALPGGDPLAAALAAGETPSPELVAAQGSANAMSPPWALTLAVMIVAGVGLVGFLSSGLVGRWNPFPDTTGEILVGLSLAGRLDMFVHAPRRFYRGPVADGDPNWSLPFELAGLNIDEFEPVEPRYQRFMHVEQRAAWVGVLPGRTKTEIRIEAGTSEGRLAFWTILAQAEQDMHEGSLEIYSGLSPWRWMYFWVYWGIITVVLAVGALLARSNLRRGRADRRGAWRLGAFQMVIIMAVGMLRSHDLSTELAVIALYPVIATGLFFGAIIMLQYMAVEPYARRVWPSMLVSWSRLLGRTLRNWRDPVLGRSVLGGLAAGTVLLFVDYFARVVLASVQGGPVRPSIGDWDVLLGQRYARAEILQAVTNSIGHSFFLACLLVVGRLVLRRTWLAVVAAIVISLIMSWGIVPGTPELAIVVVAAIVLGNVARIGVLLRFGLVGMIAAYIVVKIGPLTQTVEWTAWHSQPAIMAIIMIAALAAYGYWAATAGRSFAREVIAE